MGSALTSFSRRFSPTNQETPEEIRPPKESLTEFIGRVAPHYIIYEFTAKMIDALERVYRGEILWLFINIPPRFGKTSLLELFSAWCMVNDPTIHIGYCSYNKEIASDPCKNAREFYLAGGGQMNPSQAAKINWESLNRGKMWAAGFGGTVRGRGYHIGIIDDAHKSSDELFSEAQVKKWQSFWDKTWLNRGMVHSKRPVCRIVIGQRLGDIDVFGYILSQPDHKKWTGIVFDLEHDKTEKFPIPDAVTLIPDDREQGELLESAICTPEFMATVGEGDEREAQYQQRPRPMSGTIFDCSKFHIITRDQVPQMRIVVGGVDLAISLKQSADWSVAFPLGYGVDGRYYLFPPYRERKESPHLRREIPAHLRKFRVCAIGVDATAYQTSFVQELRADPLLAGIVVIELNKGLDKRDKVLVARSWSHLVEQELFYLVDDGSGWIATFIKEMRAFPRTSSHDDQVDGAGYAVKTVRLIGGSMEEETAAAA